MTVMSIKKTEKLKNIATISLGTQFRSRIEASPTGDFRVISMKDLGQDNTVNLNKTVRIKYENMPSNQLAKVGDIIFRSRGQTNTAAIIDQEVENTIIAAPLFRIRADTQAVIPAFLLWWINQPATQAYLNSRAKGTSLKMIGKQELADLEVTLPPLEQQHKIAELFRLTQKEQRLLETIKTCRALYMQNILMQMASHSN